jgi:hypothetical protein
MRFLPARSVSFHALSRPLRRRSRHGNAFPFDPGKCPDGRMPNEAAPTGDSSIGMPEKQQAAGDQYRPTPVHNPRPNLGS